MHEEKVRIVVGISGASGAIYGVRLLQHLKNTDVEVHLVISNAAKLTLMHECADIITLRELEEDLCYQCHNCENIGASIASGSFATAGMIVAPCSVRTMSEIASGAASNLLTRAADVTLKERRKLVLMLRETPFHLGHLRNMTALTEIGAIIAPPIPSFYHNPKSIMDIVDHSVSRVLNIFGLWDKAKEWQGLKK
ncbi:polyprenyl P-hydroxybenzoate and phenylacrylic acid decarboxylase family protein [Anaplasma phagocytophilum str. CRT53-1]|uniref:Flavin prenyltransferase UbiX n=2 Tax=Anaplasma phagocytophilum TaxID=948 RepID=A0A0F3Q187_ANAPH|nr:3-octaprenyl-4-hydroxybenzoate carboxy-lyase [Anaplasma phagocytophilum str. CRT38]KJV85916.1 polyprenyl P-hydroxybenzoate and phenylacrylic acid decarboxylase family protein [Anaplasma phagocytophilum str. CRT53-1]